jgi:preprotein translocase subunit SecG
MNKKVGIAIIVIFLVVLLVMSKGTLGASVGGGMGKTGVVDQLIKDVEAI